MNKVYAMLWYINHLLCLSFQMLFELVNVSALRLILQQPSPVWREFKIEDLKVFRASEVRNTFDRQ